MAEMKTRKTTTSVDDYIVSLDEPRRSDCRAVCDIMRAATKDEGAMWGPSIAGFGRSTYTLASGKQNDWFLVGFSSRKQALTLYVLGDFPAKAELLDRLGKHTTGKGCLYIKSIDDIHMPTLRKLIRESIKAKKAGSKGSC